MKGALYTRAVIEGQAANSNNQIDSVKEYRRASEFDEMLPESQAASELQAWLAHKEMGNPEESPVPGEHGTSRGQIGTGQVLYGHLFIQSR